MVAVRRSLSALLVLGSLLFARAGDADEKKGGVITLSDEGGIGRPYSYLAPFRRVLDGARRPLTACHELALAEYADTSTEVDAEIMIAPNGDVSSVAVSSRGAVGESTLRCVRHVMERLQFNAPGGAGWVLRAAIVMGEPHPDDQPALPFRVEPDLTASRPTLGPVVLRLGGRQPRPASAAVRQLKIVTEKCAASNKPARGVIVVARVFLTDEGQIVRAETTTTDEAGGTIAACLREAKWHGASTKVSRVEVKVAIAPNGEVSFAR
jgi:hypothetical protein